MSSADAALDAAGRVPLAVLPTPIQEAPRLARRLGLSRLLVKRDDLTGLALGGNKARKLEYELAPALAEEADLLVTVGGTQSNHAAMTAAAGRRLGLDVKLVLGGPNFERARGNLFLEALYGAEIRYLVDDDENASLAAAMDSWVDELRAAGRRPYALPIGGSTGAGALGYVRAMRELAAQVGTAPCQVVVAVGSCGTFAGLCLGARLFLPAARVVGISVSRSTPRIVERTAELVAEAARLLDLDVALPAETLECHDAFRGDYGVATAEGTEAILDAARLEGLLLDPVYTGKSMAGLIGLTRGGLLDPTVPVVFLHTGGLPILFAFDEELGVSSSVTRVSKGTSAEGSPARAPAGSRVRGLA